MFFQTIRTIAGIALGCLSLFFIFSSLAPRPTAIRPGFGLTTGKRLEGFDDRRLSRIAGENDQQFAARIGRNVYGATYNCQDLSVKQKWLIHLIEKFGLADSFGLQDQHLVGLLSARNFVCGYCHQTAYIAARALINGGVAADVFNLNNHVITRFFSDNRTFYLDPDFGVGPFSVEDPEFENTIKAAYRPISSDSQFFDVINGMLNKEDDHPYFSMDMLGELANRQEKLIAAEDFIQWAALITALFLAAPLFTWLRLGLRKLSGFTPAVNQPS